MTTETENAIAIGKNFQNRKQGRSPNGEQFATPYGSSTSHAHPIRVAG